MRPRLFKTPRRVNLRGLDGLHSNLARRRAQMLWRRDTLALQHQSALFLYKLCLFAA